MIYLDTSVALAQLLAEDRPPPEALWREPLIASRLLEYELWNRINALGLGRSHGEEARALIGRVALIEMAPPVLARALEPFPIPLRTGYFVLRFLAEDIGKHLDAACRMPLRFGEVNVKARS